MTIKAEELKPCPMCGEPHENQLNAHGFNNFSIECYSCGLNTGQKRGQQNTIKAWNTRPADLAVELIEELGEALKSAPLFSKYHTEAGLDYIRYSQDVGAWAHKRHIALSKLDAWKGRGG